MDCKGAAKLLLDFLEGNLDDEQQTGVEKHFADCPPCLSFLQGYRKTAGLCRQALMKKAPPELAERLTSFLREQTAKTRNET